MQVPYQALHELSETRVLELGICCKRLMGERIAGLVFIHGISPRCESRGALEEQLRGRIRDACACKDRLPSGVDRDAYRARNRIERMINRLKQFRRIATRYEKPAVDYLAMLHIGMLMLWL